jgi:hypothetical protein
MFAKFQWMFVIFIGLVSGCFDAHAQPLNCKDFLQTCQAINNQGQKNNKCATLATIYSSYPDLVRRKNCEVFEELGQYNNYCTELNQQIQDLKQCCEHNSSYCKN